MNKIPSDKETCLENVKKDGFAIKYVSESLFLGADYREIALAAVTQAGLALQFVHPPLWDDREVVLGAVKQDGAALSFASAKLQRDWAVVREAVVQCSFLSSMTILGLRLWRQLWTDFGQLWTDWLHGHGGRARHGRGVRGAETEMNQYQILYASMRKICTEMELEDGHFTFRLALVPLEEEGHSCLRTICIAFQVDEKIALPFVIKFIDER